MSDSVTITRAPNAQNATFETINASQSQMVFWKNHDDQAHWPVFGGKNAPSLPYQVGAHGNSSSLQPATALSNYYPPNANPIPFPQGQMLPVTYGCLLHTGESGTINCYADFFSAANQLQATRGQACTANLTTGGLAPYQFTISNSNLPPSLTVQNVAGQGPVLTGTPGPNDAGNFAFDLSCQDSDSNNIIQTFLLTIA